MHTKRKSGKKLTLFLLWIFFMIEPFNLKDLNKYQKSKNYLIKKLEGKTISKQELGGYKKKLNKFAIIKSKFLNIPTGCIEFVKFYNETLKYFELKEYKANLNRGKPEFLLI